MALECECFFVEDPRVTKFHAEVNRDQPAHKYQVPRSSKTEVDICEILKRTEDESRRHNDYECHIKGEQRQNLINKMKMFLDDYDDRPVMKRNKAGDLGPKGQTGFGPLIKYPGYVDYEHPYFGDPFNKMPQLATTVGQRRGENPCPPISVRNWDESYGAEKESSKSRSHGGAAGGSSHAGGGCFCARRKGKTAKCMAAPECQGLRGHPGSRTPGLPVQASSPALMCMCRPKQGQPMPPLGGMKYYCYPLGNH